MKFRALAGAGLSRRPAGPWNPLAWLWRSGAWLWRSGAWLWRSGTALGLILLLSGCGSGEQELSPLAPDAVVLAFGDSLTHGTGAAPDDSYPAHLAALIDRDVVREGVPGEVSRRGLQRLPGLLEELAPDLIIICHGGNDILRKLDLDETRKNLEAMIGLAREAGAEVVLVGVPARGLMLSTADLYHEVAAATGTLLEDEVVGDILFDNQLKSDAVHPNAAGYAALAQAVEELLREHGAL